MSVLWGRVDDDLMMGPSMDHGSAASNDDGFMDPPSLRDSMNDDVDDEYVLSLKGWKFECFCAVPERDGA